MTRVCTTATRRNALATIGGAIAGAACASVAKANSSTAMIHAPARGVNLSHWLAQTYEPATPAHFARFVTLERLQQLFALGFDHVRLCVDPTLLFVQSGPTNFNELQRGYLHAALDKIDASGLSTVVDLHPVGSAKDVLLRSDGAERFVSNWAILASDLQARRRRPWLEILNEPTPLRDDQWWELQGRALRAIRRADPQARVIANGGGWSGVDDLVAHRPYDVDVIYTMHFYAPLLFTHQATTWSWDVAQHVKGLSWPLSPDEAGRAADASTDDPDADRFVREAVQAGDFTRVAMAATLEKLATWQRRNGDPHLYVGEFGVYAKAAPPSARLAWLRAARSGFEQNGWGWAMWDISPDFGFTQMRDGRQAIDVATLNALGFAA